MTAGGAAAFRSMYICASFFATKVLKFNMTKLKAYEEYKKVIS